MGGFSALHWLIVLTIVGGLVWLVAFRSRGKSISSSTAHGSLGKSSPASADSRLRKLNELRAQGLINESEYQKQRASIIAGV